MTARTLMRAAAGLATLSLAACNRPAEDTTATDTAAMEAEATATTGDAAGTMTESQPSATTSGSSGGSGATATGGATAPASTTGSVAVTGQVDSAIPADAPSRNTRETAAAPGAPNNTGEVVPYAYSPTNPRVDPKR